MKTELKVLLDNLDSVAEEHEEVCDSEVREQMSVAIYGGLIVQTHGYVLPTKFGMYTPEADAAVHAALSSYLIAAIAAVEREGLSSPQQRLNAFQDESLESDAGTYYDDYFGFSEGIEPSEGDTDEK